jgi:hypothetical protein
MVHEFRRGGGLDRAEHRQRLAAFDRRGREHRQLANELLQHPFPVGEPLHGCGIAIRETGDEGVAVPLARERRARGEFIELRDALLGRRPWCYEVVPGNLIFAGCDMVLDEPFPGPLDLAELAIGHRCGEAFDLPNLKTVYRRAKDVDPAVAL